MELTRGLVVDKASILEMIVLQSPTLNEPFKVKEPESSLTWTVWCNWAFQGHSKQVQVSKSALLRLLLSYQVFKTITCCQAVKQWSHLKPKSKLKSKKNSLQNVDFSILSTETFWMFAKVRGQISKLLLFLKGSVHFFLSVFHLKCKENFDLLK